MLIRLLLPRSHTQTLAAHAVHSEFLTGAIQQTSATTGISTGFLAIIVLPIAGNACEHITVRAV